MLDFHAVCRRFDLSAPELFLLAHKRVLGYGFNGSIEEDVEHHRKTGELPKYVVSYLTQLGG